MIRTRLGGEDVLLEDAEWELWVVDGRVPPEAPVFDGARGWVPAGSLGRYRELRAEAAAPPPVAAPGLTRVVFPRRNLSSTEALLLVNLLAGAALMVLWGPDYIENLKAWSTLWRAAIRDQHAYWWWTPTLFLHVDLGHLFSNMAFLLGWAGAVEYLCGSRWVWVVYLATGLAGAAGSYFGHPEWPLLGVGASGAVFGLSGAVMTFVLRRYRSFSYRQRWKARRVYLPLFVVLTLPQVFYANYLAHLGGFAAGLVLGLWLPPHDRVRDLIRAAREEAGTREDQ